MVSSGQRTERGNITAKTYGGENNIFGSHFQKKRRKVVRRPWDCSVNVPGPAEERAGVCRLATR